MIYVTQGHEHSIGLEVFIKSFLLLSKKKQKLFTLCCCFESLSKSFNSLNIDIIKKANQVHFNGVELNIAPIGADSELPQSTTSLEVALSLLNSSTDILITLPTSKDQLILNKSRAAGYTEYLRKKFNSPDVSMLFSSPTDHALLVTDHIPLKEVTKVITADLIINKVKNVIDNISNYFDCFEEIIFSGINPHVGESGILGVEDRVVYEAMNALKKIYPRIKIIGPFSGDTLHFHKNPTKQLLVYMFHDQGLPWFKGKNKVVGLNISLGLPFLRMSVDHGTAFDLYGKGKANFLGCNYLLRSSIRAQKKLME